MTSTPRHESSSPDAHSFDVLIAGAGVGGAALALALVSRFPLRVLVVDRRSGPGNINRGDSLLPAVTEHLRAWGALPSLLAAGARPIRKMQVWHHRAGFLFEAPLTSPAQRSLPATTDAEPAPYLVLPHPEIERALIATASQFSATTGRVQVRYRCRLARLLREQDAPHRITGAVLSDDRGEHSVSARLVVGADGASSTVRALLDIPITHIPYDHSFYILETQRPPASQYEDAMRIELHPAGGILVVPQGESRIGLGVLVRTAEEELFRAGPFSEKLAAIARRSELLSQLGLPHGLAAFSQGAHLYSLHRGHAPTYHRDGAVLIGDALHVTNPTAGQGMTMAIEDAAALARHVGPALVQKRDLAPALHRYQQERWPQNDAQIRWSHWLSRFYALPGPIGDTLHEHIFRFGASPLGQRLQQRIWSRMATRDARPAPPAWSFA